MPARHAFTLVELLAVVVVAVVLVLILLPAMGGSRRAPEMKNSTQIRGQHQGAVIYAQTNAYFLPGMGTNGLPLPAGTSTTGDDHADGSTVAARYWVLLTGSFISPQLMLNPRDNLSVWTTGAMGVGNYSYCMLRITTTNADAGRRAEWKDNANGAAVLISDRNTGPDASDANVSSLWTATPGDWRGSLCWGDNHVSFELSNRLTTPTVYNQVTQTNDNLFATLGGPGITDNSTDSTSNAFMTWTN